MYWHACIVPFLFIIFFGRTCSLCSSCSFPENQWNQNYFGSIHFGRTWKNFEIKPIKPIWKSKTDQPIKPIWNQNQIKPIKRIYPSNPPPINPSTTIEFPNQETKTLVLHKTKLHGRKREEAPPRAYRRERERSMSNGKGIKKKKKGYWERSEIKKKIKKKNKTKVPNALQ